MIPLRKQVGQLLIVGLEGLELNPLEKAWLKIVQPGGVILFRRNIEHPSQTRALLAQAAALSASPSTSQSASQSASQLFRCIDLEGGLVDRLRDALAPMPSLAAVAASGKKSLYHRHGKLIGHSARAFGCNVVLAPVLDLALPDSRAVMRTRTFFAAPEKVAAYAEAFLAGLESAHVLGCGKHFPGLGGGGLDSHHATPTIERTCDELWQSDLLPYRRLKSQLRMVMVSHASYPASGHSKPASISRYWITDILHKKIGYRALILSDDMEMGGILTQTSIEDAAVQAVAAGTHLLEICKDPALILCAYEAILAEAEKSPAFQRLVQAAASKITQSKRALQGPDLNKPPSSAQIEKLRAQVVALREQCPEPKMEIA